MIICESKLRLFSLFGFLYILLFSLSDGDIDFKNLIITNTYGMIIIFIVMYIVSFISYKLIKITSLGFGDIKLSAISSIWIGYESTLFSLYIAFILSAIYSLYTKASGNLTKYHQYPFAPFISFGIICSWILDKI